MNSNQCSIWWKLSFLLQQKNALFLLANTFLENQKELIGPAAEQTLDGSEMTWITDGSNVPGKCNVFETCSPDLHTSTEHKSSGIMQRWPKLWSLRASSIVDTMFLKCNELRLIELRWSHWIVKFNMLSVEYQIVISKTTKRLFTWTVNKVFRPKRGCDIF
jgi:hypothetical protein